MLSEPLLGCLDEESLLLCPEGRLRFYRDQDLQDGVPDFEAFAPFP